MSSRGRGWWWGAFALFTLLGWTWALSVPPSGGPDESSHLVKAAAVARGELQTDVRWADGGVGLQIPQTVVEVPGGYDLGVWFNQMTCWFITVGQPVNCAPALPTETGPSVETTTYVGTYQPAYYAVVGAPTLVLGPEAGSYAARAVSALLVAALLASGFDSARRLGGSVVVAGALLAVTPAMLYLGGVINPNAVEVAAALALWTTLLHVVTTPAVSSRLVLRAAVATAVLMSVRPLAPAFAVGIVAAVLLLAADRDRLRRLSRRRAVRWSGAALGVLLVANVVHVVATGALDSVIYATPVPYPDVGERLSHAYAQSDRWTMQQIGLLSWPGLIELRVPDAIAKAWFWSIVGLVAGAFAVGTWRLRLGLLAIVGAWLLLPAIADVSRPEVAWQGRYQLPIAVGFPIVATWIVATRRRIPPRVGQVAVVVVAVLVAAAYLVAHQMVMGRNLYGKYDLTFAGRNPQAWNGPLTPQWLFVLAALGSAGLVALVVAPIVASRRSADGDDQDTELLGVA